MMLIQGLEALWEHLTEEAVGRLRAEGYPEEAVFALEEQLEKGFQLAKIKENLQSPNGYHSAIVKAIIDRYLPKNVVPFSQKTKIYTSSISDPWMITLSAMLKAQGVDAMHHEGMAKAWLEAGKSLQEFCKYRTYGHEAKPWMD